MGISSACPYSPSAIISMPIYGHIISMSSHQPHHQPSSACPSAIISMPIYGHIISMPIYGHSHIISHHQHAHTWAYHQHAHIWAYTAPACPYMGICLTSSACPTPRCHHDESPHTDSSEYKARPSG